MAISIPDSVTAGTFAATSTDARGNVVPDQYTWASTADPTIAVVNPDGSATFTGVLGKFTVTAADPLGLAGTADCEVIAGPPVSIGEPTFSPSVS